MKSNTVTNKDWNKTIQDIEKTKDITTSLIEQEYASTIVNQLLSADDSMSIFNAINKLKFYDTKLKEMGLRATIKIGTQKI